MLNTSHINIGIYKAIAEAGITGNFLPPCTSVKNIKPSTNPLTINLPDGDHINATHKFQMYTPWLPAEAKEAHIIPGLSHTYLVSIKVLCSAGCKVEYD